MGFLARIGKGISTAAGKVSNFAHEYIPFVEQIHSKFRKKEPAPINPNAVKRQEQKDWAERYGRFKQSADYNRPSDNPEANYRSKTWDRLQSDQDPYEKAEMDRRYRRWNDKQADTPFTPNPDEVARVAAKTAAAPQRMPTTRAPQQWKNTRERME